MEIEKATDMGFCFGVRRAIDIVEKATQEHGAIESLGTIVHNRQVVEKLSHCGVRPIESLDQLQGGIVAITSHGVAPQVIAQIKGRGVKSIDTTCPFVQKAQKAAQELGNAGFFVIIFGDSEHPEVQGLLGWARGKGVTTLDIPRFDKLPHRIGIISQTTQSPHHFAQFVNDIIASSLAGISELRIFNTICDATQKRHTAALELAKMVDLMLVVGGYDSANTRRLAQICSATGVETHHIEMAQDLDPAWLQDRRRAGVTAGASTPDQVIEEVVLRLEEEAKTTRHPKFQNRSSVV